MRKRYTEVLKDDPARVQKITSKQVDPTDFKAITDVYNPR